MMIRMILTSVLTILLLSANAFACHTYQYHDKRLPKYLNRGGAAERRVWKDIDRSPRQTWVSPSDDETWWGEPGDQFRIVMTITGNSHQQALGIMQDDVYQEILDLGNHPDQRIQFPEDASFTVESNGGVMWVDTLGKCGRGVDIYSNPQYNHGQRDLFSAYPLQDSPLARYYDPSYANGGAISRDDLYLLMFDGTGGSRGKGFDLLALVSRTPAGDPPAPTPIPATIFLLAGGCSGLAAWRRFSACKSSGPMRS